MKKNLALIGASALLASCGATVSVGAPTPTPVNITSDVTLDSEFVLAEPVTFQGTTFPQGYPVICDDRTTTLEYSFTYNGDLAKWTSALYGVTTNNISDLKVFTATEVPPVNGQVTVSSYTVGAATVPLGEGTVSAQAIVPTPVPDPVVLGLTSVRVRVYSDINANLSAATADDIAFSNPVPVIDNCGTVL